MERVDILNALRLVRDYCEGCTNCEGCVIENECDTNFFTAIIDAIPENWNLDDNV